MFASSSLQRRVRVSQLREIQRPATGRWSFEAGLGARACLVLMFGAKQAVELRLETSSENRITARSEMQHVG